MRIGASTALDGLDAAQRVKDAKRGGDFGRTINRGAVGVAQPKLATPRAKNARCAGEVRVVGLANKRRRAADGREPVEKTDRVVRVR